jgi:hypothetical protein
MRRRDLALPFAVVGLAGGALVGSLWFDLGARSAFAAKIFVTLTLSTTAWAAALGGLVARAPAPRIGALTAGGALVAGVGNVLSCFLIITKVLDHGPSLLSALPLIVCIGGVVALPFVPPLVLVAHAQARVDARPSSLRHAAQQRAVWSLVASVSALAAAGFPRGRHPVWFHPANAVAIVAAGALVALAMSELRAWSTFLGIEARVAGAQSEGAPDLEAEVIDYGLGDGYRTCVDATPAYRGSGRAVVVRGDPVVLRKRLHGSTLRTTLLAALALVLAGVRLVIS